jgi:hypothetical protein
VDRVVDVGSEEVGDLAGHPLGLGAGKVDLVENGDQLEPGLDGRVGVRDRLGLHALGGVDDQERALAGRQRPGHLVGEVDVAGRVDQVEVIGLAVGGRVLDANRLSLDRDPPLPLQIHRVEDLGAHLPLVERSRELEDAIGQGRFPMVDVGDDREVADAFHGVGAGRR